MSYDYDRGIRITQRIIAKYGRPAKLRRGTGDRWCVAAVVDATPAEKRERLINPTDRICVIAVNNPSGEELTPAPFHDLDTLIPVHPVTGTELAGWKFVAPIVPFAPGFVTMYYEGIVRDARYAN